MDLNNKKMTNYPPFHENMLESTIIIILLFMLFLRCDNYQWKYLSFYEKLIFSVKMKIYRIEYQYFKG